MPYKDPEKKKRYMQQWRKDAIASGYGKVIYGRRRIRFENEKRYRAAIEQALALLWTGDDGCIKEAIDTLTKARKDADKAAWEQHEAEKRHGQD